MARVLLVDDDLDLCKLLYLQLTALGFEVVFGTSAAQAVEALLHDPPDVVVTDLQMPEVNGADLCRRIVASWPDVPVIVMTSGRTVESAVAALQAGAQDFILKPLDGQTLGLRIDRALQNRALRVEVRRLRTTLDLSRNRGGILGASAAIQKIQALVDQVASSDATVLVTGESGTGKALVARALHERGKRKASPFVAVNCAALAEPVLEAELFGGAGVLLGAAGGTVLLDEVGAIPLALQARLLRALQEGAAASGGPRIVAASARDLEAEVEAGRFRLDLLYRLDVIHLELPPLRARAGDVLLLAQGFLDGFAARAGRRVVGISPEAAQKLLSYPWPGNARELQSCLERAVALARYEQIVVEDLPARVRDYQATQIVISSADPAEVLPLAEVEKRYILQSLAAFGGNKTLAARALGMGRKTLYRKLEEYEKGTAPVGESTES